MMQYLCEDDVEERIVEYYKEVLEDTIEEKERDSHFLKTVDFVVRTLKPYALDNNYWWEENNIKMAYYQMRTNLLVTRPDDFLKNYEKLMGRKYNSLEFMDDDNRLLVFQEADAKYNNLSRKR